jgi:hypothetical protein
MEIQTWRTLTELIIMTGVPYPSGPISSLAGIAVPAAMSIVLYGTAGCAPRIPSDEYPGPTATAAESYPFGTPVKRTSTPRPTPTGTATSTPTVVPLSNAVSAGVSLEEAESEVLAWLDPSREPRIEWSRYVRRDAFAGQFPWDVHFADMSHGSDDRRLSDIHDDPLIVVSASTRGIDKLAGPPVEGWLAPPRFTSTDRVPVFAVFSALTGDRKIAMAPPAPGEDEWTALALAAPTAVVNFVPEAKVSSTPWPNSGTPWPYPGYARQPTTTPTYTPTTVPSTAQLTSANLPPGVATMLDTYPLIPGTSWTWRYTLTNGNVRWEAMVLTETVESAWLEGEDVVVFSRLEAESITGAHGGDSTLADSLGSGSSVSVSLPASIQRRVTSDGIREPALTEQIVRTPKPPTGDTTDPAAIALSARFVGDDSGFMDRIAGGPADIATGAGTYSDCWAVASEISAGASSVRWFCPGVGVVQFGFGNHSSFMAWSFAELVRWQRGTLPE